MRKVLFLDYSPIFAGAERVLYNVLAHIDKQQYEPILVFPFPMEHQSLYNDIDCKKVYLAKSKKWWMGSDRWKHPLRGTDFIKRCVFGVKIASIINRYKVDILDVNLIRKDVMMWVWWTNRFTNAKIVGHYRSHTQTFVPSSHTQRLFDVVACVSEYSKMRFNLKGNYTKTSVLYDSVDIDVMKCDMSKSEAKRALGYSENDILLVSVGQLSIHKGHDNAIKAFAKISKKYPNAKLLIAGGGGNVPNNYYQDIASEMGVADIVSIPCKQLSNIQMVYRAADLTLSLTKVGEGFGLVPYESTLLGTPFIAPCFGAVCEFVKDGETGLLVDTNNVDAISNKINYALSHCDEIAHMIESLQLTIKEKLSPSCLAYNLDKLYTSLF